MPRTYEDALFAKMAEMTRSPEQRSADTQKRVHAIRDIPISEWPLEWTVDEVLAVAMQAKVPSDIVVDHLRSKYPGSFAA